MKFKETFALLFFILGWILSNAADSPGELYWNSKFENIKMPKVLRDSLQLESNNGIAKINPQFQVPVDGEDKFFFYARPNQKENDKNGKSNYGHPTLDGQNLAYNNIYSNNKERVPLDGRVFYFTQEKLLIEGTKMKLHFRRIDNGAKFLPLHIAKSVMTTSNCSLQAILNTLSLNPKSRAATYIEMMISQCELNKGVKDEVRHCVNSLEGMVDFIAMNLDSDKHKLIVVSTEVDKDTTMNYTIQKTQKIGNDDNHTMVCHKLGNPYAVYLCHNIKGTIVYDVALVGANGMQTKAISVCHKDTSNWHPNHAAFKILKLKPGNKSLCHFVSGDTIVWLRSQFFT